MNVQRAMRIEVRLESEIAARQQKRIMPTRYKVMRDHKEYLNAKSEGERLLVPDQTHFREIQTSVSLPRVRQFGTTK